MDAEPSIACDDTGVHRRLRATASLSIVLFGAGVPVVLAGVLVRYREQVGADQELRQRGEGDTVLTNPHLAVRRKFGKVGWPLVGFFVWCICCTAHATSA